MVRTGGRSGAHRAVSQQCHVSMLSAPATMPATSALTLAPALAPLSVGTVRCSSANTGRPHCWANATIGTSRRRTPDWGHRSSPTLRAECEIVASTRCPSLWPNVILEKSHSSATTGHFGVTTHFAVHRIGGSRLRGRGSAAGPPAPGKRPGGSARDWSSPETGPPHLRGPGCRSR